VCGPVGLQHVKIICCRVLLACQNMTATESYKFICKETSNLTMQKKVDFLGFKPVFNFT